MKTTLKERFPPFMDELSLRAAILSICAEFGNVKQLSILPASPGSSLQCACFLQFDDPGASARLRSKLHVTEFGDDLAFFADVDRAWTGPKL